MKKINYKSIGEVVYEETLPNGLKVVYYPTYKSKNFYITVSTNYGANVTEYIKNGKKIKVIPGTAHFLEHRVMDFTKNKKAMNLINGLGSAPNAYTMHDITNYNIIGSVDIKKNIELLFDRVFKPNITESDVENEKGIIAEEIDMENDNINYCLMDAIFQNAFIKDRSISTPILGTKESINKITHKYLEEIYKDFYTYDRMHVVVTGNFSLDEISEFINNYFEKTKNNKKNIKIPYVKEPKEVKMVNSEIHKDVLNTKTSILFKIPIEKIKDIKSSEYNKYIGLIIECLLGSTSELNLLLREKNLTQIGYFQIKTKDYNILQISASGSKSDEFIKIIKNAFNNIKITKKEFDTKIKVAISSLILNFEDIVEVENMLTNYIKTSGKIVRNEKNNLLKLKYSDLKKVIKSLDFSNYTMLKIHKK